MEVQTVHEEEWDDCVGAYVPTDAVIGYRAVSDRGDILGFGDTKELAVEAARRSIWRVDKCDGLIPIAELLRHKVWGV